jgi:hypothetical protein
VSEYPQAVQPSGGTADTQTEPAVALGPVRPSAIVRAELVRFLEDDGSRLGEVHRGLGRGLNADQIASELKVSTSNFVWNYSRIIAALTEGDLPTATTVALAAARKVRAMLRLSWSQDARVYLETNLVELERRANDETARVVEVQRAQEQTVRAEARNETGIYVYALPHYLRYPFDPDTGRTLMKVGRSDSDVIMRFRSQTRTTALPEEPILLRIYRTDSATGAVESSFHRLLEAADHSRSIARTAGREWFVTSTRFLDEVARVLNLPIEAVNDAEVVDEV